MNLEFDLNNVVVRAQRETGPQPSLRDVVGNPSVRYSDNARRRCVPFETGQLS